MSRHEHEAVDAFEQLGLTRYEAKVFIALQRLGSGTAREVADIVDVPRSQVYGVAERLEARGLIEVQQSSPIRYRAVDIDQARERLQDRLESKQERAFAYVERVRDEQPTDESHEEIWTIRGRDRIDDRVFDLLETATARIIYGTRIESLVAAPISTQLKTRATETVPVTIVSQTVSISAQFESHEHVTTFDPQLSAADDRSGRILIVDDDTILLSVIDVDGHETAIWSSDSLFSSVLIQLVEASIGLSQATATDEAPGS